MGVVDHAASTQASVNDSPGTVSDSVSVEPHGE